jgi:hypothetical protein
VIASTGARARRVEDRLLIGTLRIDDDRHLVVAELEDLRRKADALCVARAEASIDLDAIRHMTAWGSRALR